MNEIVDGIVYTAGLLRRRIGSMINVVEIMLLKEEREREIGKLANVRSALEAAMAYRTPNPCLNSD